MSVSAMTVIEQLEQRGVQAQSLCADSRAVVPGDVFVAMQGHQVDGRAYIADAVRRGAVAVLAEAGAKVPPAASNESGCAGQSDADLRRRVVGAGDTPIDGVTANRDTPIDGVTANRDTPKGGFAAATDTPIIEVAQLDQLAGDLANIVYGRPSERLWMAGITGTNGKTSVSQWIAQAVKLRGGRCTVIGTLGNGYPAHLLPSPNTTPDAIMLHRLLARYAEEGATACAMEVSSIGLDQGRVNGVHFDVAVFTNLTRDHLEYHGSMAAYGAAKARLFETPGLNAAVLNLDDPCGRELARRLAGRVRTIGYTLEARGGTDQVLAARNLAMTGAGIAFELDGIDFAAPVVGRFNASNLLAVIGALLAGDAALTDIAAVLPQLQPPPGRMQVLGGNADLGQPLVVVDYAHSPDALEKALDTLRETAHARGGRLVCVFGCGGERDPGKRPLMGEVAERLADRVIVTSDNPRSEAPQAIIDAVVAGMKTSPAVEPDRAAAIAAAIAAAAARDVVLLAGKGHEPYQEIAGVRHPFSDVDTARSALATRRQPGEPPNGTRQQPWQPPFGTRR